MPSPEETTATARAFLADHPDAEAALVTLVERNADDEPWTFADIELDSGQFGELVARDLATAVEDGYQLENPAAIRAVIDAGPTTDADASPADTGGNSSHSAPTSPDAEPPATLLAQLGSAFRVDRSTFLGLVGALFAVAAARLVAAPAVFREGFVVSPSNDTYFFRYWQERLVARADGIFDFGLFADMGGAASTRPLAHATNWWVTVLIGGGDAAPIVAAWLPVVASLCVGYLVYWIARLLTDDVRVALAAVLFYGLAPVNVVYTSVGFLDHQAHQYLWLGLLVGTLVALATDVTQRLTHAESEQDRQLAGQAHALAPRSWLLALSLAIAVAASAHAWGGSPLTFIPVAAAVGFRVILDVRHDISPALANAPLLAGLTIGGGMALAAHHWLGWHESIAAVTPLLVAGGAVAVAGLGAVWRRVSLPLLGLVVAEAAVAVGGLFGYAVLRPDDIRRFQIRAEDLFLREGVTETASLFSPDFGVVAGPLLQLGLGFYFAIAVLLVVTWVVTRRYEPAWLILVCFAWYYTLLATIQVRFAGQLAIIIAPFAGIGLIYLLAAVDIARPISVLSANRGESTQSSTSLRDRTSRKSTTEQGSSSLTLPDNTRLRGYLVVTVGFVLLFNLLLVPPLVGQTTHDRAQFDAALTIDSHAEQVNREYPANFVLTQWDNNRMYNYFVSGESESYGYARNTHVPFLRSPDPDDRYNQFRGQVGYVVVTEREDISSPNVTYTALYDGLGLGANDTTPTGHYQLIVADDGVRGFTVVPGAVIQVSDPAGETVTVTTNVTVGTGTSSESYEYTRRATVTNGTATTRVVHPGEYRVGDRSITVTNDDILTGNQTTVQIN